MDEGLVMRRDDIGERKPTHTRYNLTSKALRMRVGVKANREIGLEPQRQMFSHECKHWKRVNADIRNVAVLRPLAARN
jgi:hypothetical protein